MGLWLGGQLSMREIGNFLCCSNRTVRRYITLFCQTGDMKAAQCCYTSARILDDHICLSCKTQAYVHELQLKLPEIFGVRVYISTIYRTLKFMDCTRQVILHVAIQRSDTIRAMFMADISLYDSSILVWIDESACDRRNSIKKYGYSVCGMRPVYHRLLIRGTRFSAIPLMSVQGIYDVFYY